MSRQPKELKIELNDSAIIKLSQHFQERFKLFHDNQMRSTQRGGGRVFDYYATEKNSLETHFPPELIEHVKEFEKIIIKNENSIEIDLTMWVKRFYQLLARFIELAMTEALAAAEKQELEVKRVLNEYLINANPNHFMEKYLQNQINQHRLFRQYILEQPAVEFFAPLCFTLEAQVRQHSQGFSHYMCFVFLPKIFGLVNSNFSEPLAPNNFIKAVDKATEDQALTTIIAGQMRESVFEANFAPHIAEFGLPAKEINYLTTRLEQKFVQAMLSEIKDARTEFGENFVNKVEPVIQATNSIKSLAEKALAAIKNAERLPIIDQVEAEFNFALEAFNENFVARGLVNSKDMQSITDAAEKITLIAEHRRRDKVIIYSNINTAGSLIAKAQEDIYQAETSESALQILILAKIRLTNLNENSEQNTQFLDDFFKEVLPKKIVAEACRNMDTLTYAEDEKFESKTPADREILIIKSIAAKAKDKLIKSIGNLDNYFDQLSQSAALIDVHASLEITKRKISLVEQGQIPGIKEAALSHLKILFDDHRIDGHTHTKYKTLIEGFTEPLNSLIEKIIVNKKMEFKPILLERIVTIAKSMLSRMTSEDDENTKQEKLVAGFLEIISEAKLDKIQFEKQRNFADDLVKSSNLDLSKEADSLTSIVLYAWREAYKQACPDQEYLDALEQGRIDFIGNLGKVKNAEELHDLAFQIKAKLLKNEFLTDGEAEKYEEFCSEINRLGKEKIDQMQKEPKKNLGEFFQKNKKAGYLLLTGGGLLAASVFIGHSHTHLLNNSIVHLGIQTIRALASASCALGIGSAVGFFSRFKKTEEKALPKPHIEIDEKVQVLALDKLRTASVAAFDLCRQQWSAVNNPGFNYANKLAQYGSPLALSRLNPASFVIALIKIIEKDREKNQLGLMLEENIKEAFFIPDANSDELITELKEFNKICIPAEINKVRQSLDLAINDSKFIKKITERLNSEANFPEAQRFAKELSAENLLEKIKWQVNTDGNLGERLVNILNIVCETGADPIIWRQVLDKTGPSAQPCLKLGLR